MPAIASQCQPRMRAMASTAAVTASVCSTTGNGFGVGARDEQRRDIAAERAERGERRPVDDREEQRDEPRRGQEHEGGGVADEAVERVGRVDRGEGGDAARAGQDRRNVGLGEDRRVRGAVAAAQPFARARTARPTSRKPSAMRVAGPSSPCSIE